MDGSMDLTNELEDNVKGARGDRREAHDGAGASETAREAAGAVMRKAKLEAAEVADTARAQGQRVGRRAKATGARVADEVKDLVAERLSDAAQTLRASERRTAEARGAASGGLLLEPVAGAVERVAAYLRGRSGEELWRDFRSSSDHQPLLTYAGLFALGAAAAFVAKRMLFEEVGRGA